ncbi:hypothetical protein N7512_005505 [Penicillium capsulatum]|nr:hypothetical protein N7512_005505 [Penicillium capsulatum]
MRVYDLSTQNLVNCHREIDPLLLGYYSTGEIDFDMAMPNPRTCEWDMGHMHGGCDSASPCHVNDPTDVPTQASPDFQSSGYPSSLDFTTSNPELVPSCLTPGGYLPSQQGSPASEAAGSAYA